MLHVMNTNLGGPMRYIREALKIFLKKNEGVIINVSSVNGLRPFCGATYTSTKGALNTLTKNVATRLIATDIRCNAVAPGATVTPAHLANRDGKQPGGDKMLEYSGRYVYFPGPECDPMDQAYACLYLASNVYYSEPNRIVLFYQDAQVSREYTPIGYFDITEKFVSAVKENPILEGWSNKVVHIAQPKQ